MGADIGDRVRIDYVGTLADGTLFETTEDKGDVEFVIGENTIIKGLENAVVGMAEGERKQVSVGPEEAYGPVNPELIVRDVPKTEIHENIKPAPGMLLQWDLPNDQNFTVKIIAVDEDTVSFDGNHLLAGETLNFDITLLEICKPG